MRLLVGQFKYLDIPTPKLHYGSICLFSLPFLSDFPASNYCADAVYLLFVDPVVSQVLVLFSISITYSI